MRTYVSIIGTTEALPCLRCDWFTTLLLPDSPSCEWLREHILMGCRNYTLVDYLDVSILRSLGLSLAPLCVGEHLSSWTIIYFMQLRFKCQCWHFLQLLHFMRSFPFSCALGLGRFLVMQGTAVVSWGLESNHRFLFIYLSNVLRCFRVCMWKRCRDKGA